MSMMNKKAMIITFSSLIALLVIIGCCIFFSKTRKQENINDVLSTVEEEPAQEITQVPDEQIEDLESKQDPEEPEEPVDEKWVKSLLTYQADCQYVLQDGSEYRMVGTDRACGSTYYTFIHVSSDGQDCELVNRDPYLGSGGNANWILFLPDEKTGFSCLAYSGGSLGQLYRTDDGGKSFSYIEYPSGNAELSDGTYYNPFVMPMNVWEEDDMLYMDVGQGPEGDYYNDEGFCHALYSSTDKGITWKYEKEFAVTRGEDEEW